MKNLKGIVWGVALVLVGVLFGLNALNVTNIDVWFDGWWTLFIIIPSAIGLITEKEKIGNGVGLIIGVLLLLCCQGVFDFDWIWKLAFPILVIVVGVSLVFKGLRQKDDEEKAAVIKDGAGKRNGCAVFSGCDMHFDGQTFEGAELTAVFGGVECDLRKAIIEKDCAIKATAIFGGIDILVPDNVKVKTDSTGIFGGTDNAAKDGEGNVTLYITAFSMFGGVDIK